MKAYGLPSRERAAIRARMREIADALEQLAREQDAARAAFARRYHELRTEQTALNARRYS